LEVIADPIIEFSGDHAFLSNFHPSPLTFSGGVVFPTVEHAFQAFETLDTEMRERIRLADTPGRAKRLGRQATLRPNWNHLRIPTMAALLTKKFTQHPDLGEQLVDNFPAVLVEGNNWNDEFWGMIFLNWPPSIENMRGENNLGRLLMETRDSLRQEIVLLQMN